LCTRRGAAKPDTEKGDKRNIPKKGHGAIVEKIAANRRKSFAIPIQPRKFFTEKSAAATLCAGENFQGETMKLRWTTTIAFCLFFTASAVAQRKPIPRPVFAAKTVAIVNHAHNDAVEASALESLKRWGKFTVVDDPETADIVITFEKKSEHESKNTETTKNNNDGQPEASSTYSMSFGSSLTMKATMKGSTTPFYTATNSDSKKKGGAACVVDFQSAYNQDR
jgi:hypothetical protein